jgi:hypothetical protein
MIVQVEDFYKNSQNILSVVKPLNFKDSIYGHEIPEFFMIPEGIDQGFSAITNISVKLRENSGLFRIPYPTIHFENFDQKSLFIGIVALEDTVFRTHRHRETQSHAVTDIVKNLQQFIKENCFDKEKWDIIAEINLKAGGLILVKPWLWHSLEEKLVKIFYLEFSECVNAEAAEPVVKDGSSEMHTVSNLALENHAVS